LYNKRGSVDLYNRIGGGGVCIAGGREGLCVSRRLMRRREGKASGDNRGTWVAKTSGGDVEIDMTAHCRP